MAEKTTQSQEDEVSRLRARVSELETELQKGGGRRQEQGRVGDSLSDASRQKIDIVSRMFRGLTIASIEGMRLFAESATAFADGVVSRNKATESTSPRDLVTRLPADVASGIADAVDRLADIPAKTAERYAEAFREGQKSTREGQRSSSI